MDENSNRISRIKPFTDEYNWEDINFPSVKDDLKKYKKNNLIIALDVLYIDGGNFFTDIGKIYLTYLSTQNPERGKQIILIMILNKLGWYYITVTRLSALLRGITSTHNGDFYCLDYLHSFEAQNKLESQKNVCENKKFCDAGMFFKENMILKFKQHQKSAKVPAIIYVNLESLIKKVDECINNP